MRSEKENTNVIPLLGVERFRMGMDGDGITTLVGFYGCPLECKYCLNPQCRSSSPCSTLSLSPIELYEQVKRDNIYFLASGGGVTFGGGEPLLQSEFIKEFRQIAPTDWCINVETSLNVPKCNLIDVVSSIDNFIIDIKDMNPVIYKAYTGKDNEMVMENLRLLSVLGRMKNVVVKVPHIRGYNTNQDVFRSTRKLYEMGFLNITEVEYICMEH